MLCLTLLAVFAAGVSGIRTGEFVTVPLAKVRRMSPVPLLFKTPRDDIGIAHGMTVAGHSFPIHNSSQRVSPVPLLFNTPHDDVDIAHGMTVAGHSLPIHNSAQRVSPVPLLFNTPHDDVDIAHGMTVPGHSFPIHNSSQHEEHASSIRAGLFDTSHVSDDAHLINELQSSAIERVETWMVELSLAAVLVIIIATVVYSWNMEVDVVFLEVESLTQRSARESASDSDENEAKKPAPKRPVDRQLSYAENQEEFSETLFDNLESMDMSVWHKIADAKELDLYTCLGLSIGLHGLWSERVRRYLPEFLISIAMQFLLPLLLVIYQVSHVTFHTDIQSSLFRLIGFILFLFSIRSMYQGSLDECRTWVISVMMDCSVSGAYIWPPLLGEFINAFCGWTMTATTFLIYCDVPSVEELLLNCCAVAFITEVDNQLLSEWMVDWAKEDFAGALEEWKFSLRRRLLSIRQTTKSDKMKEDEAEELEVARAERNAVKYICKAVRIVGIIGTGMGLAFVFSIAHYQNLCNSEASEILRWKGLICPKV